MLQETFGDNAMNQSKTLLWYKRFKDGRTSVDDDERSGRPSTSTTPENIAKVREAILADRRQNMHDVCEIVGLSYGTVQRILAGNLNMKTHFCEICAKTAERRPEGPSRFCLQGTQKQARDDPNFISNIITGDETWVYGYDPETKQQSSQWSCQIHRGRKKARQVRSNVKSMLIVFSDIQGTVHKESLPPWSNRQWQVLL